MSGTTQRRACDFGRLWKRYDGFLRDLIDRGGLKRVCDIGGGRNPRLDAGYVASRGLDYTVLDISPAELALTPAWATKVCGDVAGDPPPAGLGPFDLCFSRMLAEHVKDGRRLHANVWSMLRPGGLAVHFFPTLYCLPFLVNRWVPEAVSDRLLEVFSPRDRTKQGKFPAYYSWTRGPTRRQVRRLEGLGYEVPLYVGGFGHAYYRSLPGIRGLARAWAGYCARRELYAFTTFGVVVLRRPMGRGEEGQAMEWPEL